MTEKKSEDRGNPIRDAIINIVIPSFVLMKLSDPKWLGPLPAFVLALAIPFSYGVWSAIKERKLNWLASLGLANILAAGALRYFEVGRLGFAIKEALTPTIIALAVIVSQKTGNPLVSKLLYNDKILNVTRINSILSEKKCESELDGLLRKTTWLLASSFVLSAVLNFSLAIYFLKSPVDSVEFTKELGTMTAVSWPVIVLPCMAIMGFALWFLGSGLRKLTGLDWEGVLKVEEGAKGGA
jgi:hypothetical protein